MPRRPANITQSDVARAIYAAKQAGAAAVALQQPNGSVIRILVNAPVVASEQPAPDRDIIL
jgi:hypothetical protein